MSATQGRFLDQFTLITGGTKGLGFATAQYFAEEGSNLLLSYRSDEKAADEAKSKILAMGVDCHLIQVDLCETEGGTYLGEQVKTLVPHLNYVVWNAAASAFKPLLEMKHHHFAKTFHLSIWNLLSTLQTLKGFLAPRGAVVTVSGMDTLHVVPQHGMLAAAKGALEVMTTYLAHELGPQKIRVNGVNPGFLETESTQKFLGPFFPKVSEAHSRATVFNRPADFREVAQVIGFLCSPESNWVAGQTITVDGGFNDALTLPGFGLPER
ncbi:MAG: SDR family oxidoreductase [Bdellovibrionaceae bacterium]|nr:SDR family oxidoreductase [Bdellovibrionales bacterium]MCB9083026.1 SDR family oxidoreductase [Pseudobdellovibrionaceae bacterium]